MRRQVNNQNRDRSLVSSRGGSNLMNDKGGE